MPSPNRFNSQKVLDISTLKYRNARGFTLIEVLVATVILASALVVIVQNLARTQQALRISQNLVFATEIGVNKLSAIELEQQERIRLSVQHDQGKEKLLGKVFQWQSDVGPYLDESIVDQTKLNQAQVSVLWQEGKTRETELRFGTLFLTRDQKKYETA